MPCFRTPMNQVLLGQDADTACSLDLSYVLCSFVIKVNVSLCSKLNDRSFYSCRLRYHEAFDYTNCESFCMQIDLSYFLYFRQSSRYIALLSLLVKVIVSLSSNMNAALRRTVNVISWSIWTGSHFLSSQTVIHNSTMNTRSYYDFVESIYALWNRRRMFCQIML